MEPPTTLIACLYNFNSPLHFLLLPLHLLSPSIYTRSSTHQSDNFANKSTSLHYSSTSLSPSTSFPFLPPHSILHPSSLALSSFFPLITTISCIPETYSSPSTAPFFSTYNHFPFLFSFTNATASPFNTIPSTLPSLSLSPKHHLSLPKPSNKKGIYTSVALCGAFPVLPLTPLSLSTLTVLSQPPS